MMLAATVLLWCTVGGLLPSSVGAGGAGEAQCTRAGDTLRCIAPALAALEAAAAAAASGGGGGGGGGAAPRRVELRCTAGGEAALADRHFGRLRSPAELALAGCALRRVAGNAFEGLRGLKALALNTLHTEPLELAPGAFNGLRELHALDLGRSGIRRIPSDLFCALENVISLNLTHNRIKFVDELGFGRECGSTLQTLDLSHNEVMSLPADARALRLRRLARLLLHDNRITELLPPVFAELLSLKVVNLSSNAIEHLPEELFSSTKEIREIYIRNNALETLPRRIFNRLDQLVVLDISYNKLRSELVESGTFAGLIRLIVLDLSHNALASIARPLFEDLFFLQILDLSDNLIESVEDDAFSPLFNLHTLNIGRNRLHTIEDQMFNGLFILNKLSLNNNLLSYVSDNAFRNCSDLKELDLSSNKLTQVPEAISQLSFLKSLDLGENLLTEIRNDSFRNLSQLTGLRLIENRIGNLTAGMFWELPNLQVLNLAKNKIQSITTETFQKNINLEAVRLDGNFISDINGVFVSLTKLLWLNLSENHLVWFDYAFIPGSLKWLDVHANFIEILGNYYKIQSELHVKTLDVSHNRLVSLSAMSIPNSVELLFVNNNFIKNVERDTFLEKSNLTRVDMYANEIESMDMDSLRVRVADERALPEFYISGNPFRCDCTMKWLLLINSLTSRQYPRLMDLENVVCKESYVRGVKYLPVSSLRIKDFLCKYESYCPDDCHCCDFIICTCKIICPRNCSCYHDSTKTTNVVDCSVQQLWRVPQGMPTDATHIYLDGNVYNELNDTVFDSLHKALVLYLNSSDITFIHNNTFDHFIDLKILHLDNNKLKRLRGLEFSKLSNLKELYLQNNKIEYISNDTFSFLGALEVLRLDGNKLLNYGLWHLDNNKRLQTLFIGNNNWVCDCKYLQGFLTFVTQNVDKVVDVHSLWCVNEKANPSRKQLNLNVTVCSEIFENSMISALFVSNNLPLLASVLTGLTLVLLILASVFAFRYACRSWLYDNCGIKLLATGDYDDTDKLYDAYVCYSPKDEEFVVESLAHELETGHPSYHLCLHYRDVPRFEATYAQFPDLVIEATQASRRIIVVLTRNFVATEWSQNEFRSALQRALHKNHRNLIVVTAEPVQRDAELKSYLKAGQEITWKEKRFWERLRQAMPSRRRRELRRLARGRGSNAYTMEAGALTATSQTLCGPPSADRSPAARPPFDHIYSSIDCEYAPEPPERPLPLPLPLPLPRVTHTYLV